MSELKDLEVIILCGGLGTRLREETEFRPKPMVEIGGHPILWHIMRHYSHFDMKKFILCLGYKGDVIRDYFLNYRSSTQDVSVSLNSGDAHYLGGGDKEVLDWDVVLADTGLQSLTGQRLKRALKYVSGNTFLVTYGDGVSDVDLEGLLAHHRKMGKLATVTAVHPASRFGDLQIEGDLVKDFFEKSQDKRDWINGGFFVFEREVFDLIGDDRNISLEEGILTHLAAKGELSAYMHEGYWQCMDTYREAQLLNELWQSGKAPWRSW